MEYKGQVVKKVKEEMPFEPSNFWSVCRDANLREEDLKDLLQGSDQKSYEQLDKVLEGLLGKLLDKNNRDQEAASLAFTTLVKAAGENLVPHLGVILQHIVCAFGTNQMQNIGIVYHAIRTLAKSVEEELKKPAYLESMIPPLVAKWQQVSNSDKDLYLMLECFTKIAQALDNARVIPFVQPVFERCININQVQQLVKADLAPPGTQYDKELIIHSLDCLCSLVKVLKKEIKSLVLESNLRYMLLTYCMDNASDVRERAFALISVLARVFPDYLERRLHVILEIANQQLSANVIRENVNVAINACLVIGELAVKFPQKVSPIVSNVVFSLGLILRHRERINKKLIDSSTITLGRLAWIFPDLVASQMEHYFMPWCQSFSMLYDDTEKKETLRGLCAVVKVNPLGVGSSLFYICHAIASWHPVFIEMLMSPLVAKLQQLSNSDRDLFPLLNCFTFISQGLGVRFVPFAQPVFQRCMDIIHLQMLAKVDLAPAGTQYDKEFIIRSLDFLYNLAIGLMSGLQLLVTQNTLRDMVIQLCMDNASDVRERAFALVGALARVFPAYLQPHLYEILEIASQQLRPNVIRENVNVATIACWAIGELAVKVCQEVSPIVTNVVFSLGLILQHREVLNKALVENSAVTFGRLAWIRPDLVALHMEHFLEPWCLSLSMLHDGIQKEEAFRGLCAVVKVNPLGVGDSLFYICQAFASWNEIRSNVQSEVSLVFNVYKSMFGENFWEACLSFVDPHLKERLARY